MFKDIQEFLDCRTTDAEIDIDQYRDLLRWLTYIATKGEHTRRFAQKHSPNGTWASRRNRDDIEIAVWAFPFHDEKGITHIELFNEGHPVYSSLGINAIVGTRDKEGLLQLCVLSSDGENSWVNMLRGGDPLGADGFTQLVEDFHDIVV